MIKLSMQKGQIVVILLLVMVIALAVGLSVTTRSMKEISFSSSSESSSRAFSAAEAGLERILKNFSSFSESTGSLKISSLGNTSEADVSWDKGLPNPGQAIEYNSLVNKDLNGVAQFWLADPNYTDLIPPQKYIAPQFDLYFGLRDDSVIYSGTNAGERPAAEVMVISTNGSTFTTSKYYVDTDSGRVAANGFTTCSNFNPLAIDTTVGTNRTFYCRMTIGGYANYPVLARVRLLYSTYSHPVALKPCTITDCPSTPNESDRSFPYQIQTFTSLGKSGSTARTLKIQQQIDVMPFFMDYALFSVPKLEK